MLCIVLFDVLNFVVRSPLFFFVRITDLKNSTVNVFILEYLYLLQIYLCQILLEKFLYMFDNLL